MAMALDAPATAASATSPTIAPCIRTATSPIRATTLTAAHRSRGSSHNRMAGRLPQSAIVAEFLNCLAGRFPATSHYPLITVSVALRHFLMRQLRLRVAFRLLPRRKLRRLVRNLLIRNAAQDIANTVQP